MWKKFLAVMALVGVLSTQTASAWLVDDQDAPDNNPPVASFTVTPETFNPGAGESVEVTLAVNEPSLVTVKVIDPVTSETVDTLYASEVVQESKTVTYGGLLDDGTPVADGVYDVDASVVTLSRTGSQDASVSLTVVSTPAELTVTELEADASVLDLTVVDAVLKFTFAVNKEADVALEIKDGEDVIKTFDALTGTSGEFAWDGRDDDGSLVEAGTYEAVLTATTADETATSSVDVEVKYNGTADSFIITNVEVDPNPWDPSDEELDIEWELEEDVDDFLLYAKQGNEEIELWEDEDMDDDDYELEWNGMDDDDDYIDEGVWELVFEADDDTVSYFVTVEYEAPEIDNNAFVTKTSFDNTIGESSYVVFLLETDAIVTIEVMDGNKDIVTLMDEEELEKEKWYAVEWDGTDDDGDEVDDDETYDFLITAANVANDDVETTMTIDVDVEEDDPSNKTNATNDFINPIVVPKGTTEGAQITYTIDDDAEVTLEIFKGNKSSSAEIVLEDDVLKAAGTYTVSWDGRDEDGKKLDKDEKYSYRVIARTVGSNSKTDKERGFFVIGYEGGVDGEPDPTPKPNPENCGFYDVNSTSPYCEAIAWVKANGIFEGNPNGTFGQYEFLNRAEALKVVLEAFDVPVLADDYTNLGFSDTIVGEWYMKYLRTGKFYGMVAGYAGTTEVRPDYEINRVELLKYVLEAAETVQNYAVPVCNVSYYNDTMQKDWYSDYVCTAHDYDLYNTYSGYFYPGNKVMRGEVALLLYRLNEAGLLQ